MSSVLKAIGTSHRLTMAAAEEAQRSGSLAIDQEHLLIALSGSSTAAGQALREAGAVPAAVRQAVEDQHAANLASLDIQVAPEEVATARIAGPQDVEWNERARRIFTDSSSDASGTALLRALAEEPVGSVAAVLERLSVPSAIWAGAATQDPVAVASPRSGSDGAVALEVFLETDIEDVWALLDDPASRPEWDSTVASMSEQPDGSWLAGYRVGVPGTDEPYPSRRLDRRIKAVARRRPSTYEWEISWPASRPARRAQRLRVDLRPTGTQTTAILTVTPVVIRGLRGAGAALTGSAQRARRALALSRTAARLARAVEIRAADGGSAQSTGETSSADGDHGGNRA